MNRRAFLAALPLLPALSRRLLGTSAIQPLPPQTYLDAWRHYNYTYLTGAPYTIGFSGFHDALEQVQTRRGLQALADHVDRLYVERLYGAKP